MQQTVPAELAPDNPEPGEQTAIARQAILDANRAVFGYELFDRTQAPRPATRSFCSTSCRKRTTRA
jgi:hypothetical protein